MANEPKKPAKDDKGKDGRGPRPKDPNALAKWIVDKATEDKDDKD